MRTSVSREAPVIRARRRRDFSVADLAILENVDDLLRSFKESKDEKSYLTHERSYHPFKDALVNVFPVVSGILGVTSNQGVPECEFSPELIRKYSVFLCQTLRIACSGTNERSCAESVCLCFAALARRIETVEDVGIRRQELQLLFLQMKAWVDESSYSAKELEVMPVII
uniref:Fungal_trans domain-containing protein n=1 Tax=Angiostrongylus cantonensis TaxID=6313 RepID=A0A0K0D6E7_ANGCA